jgi:hypothetical protein
MKVARGFDGFAAWADGFSAAFVNGAEGAAKIVRARRDGFAWTDADGRTSHLAYGAASGGSGRVVVRLADGFGLIRPLAIPKGADPGEAARLNLTRLSPLAVDETVFALGPGRPVGGEMISAVHIAARADVARIVSAARAAGWTVANVDIEDPSAPDAPVSVNLLGAPSTGRAPAWVLTGLVLACMAAAAWGAFGPPAPGAAARAFAADIAARPSASALLGAAAGALPDDVALTGFSLRGAAVTLEGEANDPASLIDLIDSAGPFQKARLAGPPERPPGSTRARFVLTAEVK